MPSNHMLFDADKTKQKAIYKAKSILAMSRYGLPEHNEDWEIPSFMNKDTDPALDYYYRYFEEKNEKEMLQTIARHVPVHKIKGE